MWYAETYMVVILLVWLGLSMGSFVGALTWRMHKKKNFVNDRSICEHCKHVLAWYDLIPLISWLRLKGRCRYCKKSIGWLAPVLEAGTASLFVLSYLVWPYALNTVGEWLILVLWLVIVVGLVALLVFDIRWMLLPDSIVLPLIGIAFGMRLLEVFVFDITPKDFVGAQILGLLVGAGLFFGLHVVSKGRWMGGGDITLGMLIGTILGPLGALIALMIGFYSATLFILPLMAAKKLNKKSKVPFGPFLIIGLIVAQLWQEPLRQLYNSFIGLQ